MMKSETFLKSPIFWGSTASGAILGITVLLSSPRQIQDFSYSISLLIIFGVIGYIWDVLHSRMIKIEDRVNLWVTDRHEIAKQLEKIVKLLNKAELIDASITLNGAEQVLQYKGLSRDALRGISNIMKKCKKFRGIAVYGPGEWMDPLWFAYLIAQAALLKKDTKDAERFFIYEENVINSIGWGERLGAIVEAIQNAFPAYLCPAQNIEKQLKEINNLQAFLTKLYKTHNENQEWVESSLLPLLDIIYMENAEGKKFMWWRNPGKKGQPEELNEQNAEEFAKFEQKLSDILKKNAVLMPHNKE